MNMARIHGRRGAVYAAVASGGTAEPISSMANWSLSAKTDRIDVTAFGDENKQYLAGLPDAQGTFEGFYDDASNQFYTAATDGIARKCYLYPDRTNTSVYWFGTAFFDMEISTPVGDAVKVSGSFAASSNFIRVG